MILGDKIVQGSSHNANLRCQVLSAVCGYPVYLLGSSLPSMLSILASKCQGSKFLRHNIFFYIFPVTCKLQLPVNPKSIKKFCF